jgi:hypothetical protein
VGVDFEALQVSFGAALGFRIWKSFGHFVMKTFERMKPEGLQNAEPTGERFLFTTLEELNVIPNGIMDFDMKVGM